MDQQRCRRFHTVIFLVVSSFWECYSLVEPRTSTLLNAYRSPLSALTAPNNFYFLEFPLDDERNNDSETHLSPICGDGSPYSFAFKRGSDEHLSKLVVEFQGGPVCLSSWGNKEPTTLLEESSSNNTATEASPCTCQHGMRQTPWNEYVQTLEPEVVASGLFPALNSCTGVSKGFVGLGHSELMNAMGAKEDIPLGIRGQSDGHSKGKEWWQSLDKDIQDWSYLLLPHCTLDWNLGHRSMPAESAEGCSAGTHYFRGGSNMEAVLDWINEQFRASGGLDALITLPGGKLGGCSSSVDEERASTRSTGRILSNVGAMLFADGATMKRRAKNQLILVEGSDLVAANEDETSLNPQELRDIWNPKGLLATIEGMSLDDVLLVDIVQDLVLKTQASFAWFGGIPVGGEEELMTTSSTWLALADVIRARSDTFHLYIPSVEDVDGDDDDLWFEESCPVYTFPDKSIPSSNDDGIKKFIQKVVQGMTWSSETATSNVSSSMADSYDDEGFRLTFLSIVIIIIALYLSAWMYYFFLMRRHQREGILPLPPSPHRLWLTALTHHPRIFLLISLFIPLLLSFLGFAKTGYQVQINLDFETYLEIETDLETVSRSYSAAQDFQEGSLQIEEANCELLDGNYRRTSSQKTGYRIQESSGPQHFTPGNRDLQYTLLEPSGPVITIIYQNRNGGTVFTPEVLRSIRDFEQSIYDFPGFEDNCFAPFGRCVPFDSIVPSFFPNGGLANNIDGVLRTFLDDENSLWKMDQFFGPNNLGSNITRTFVWLRDEYRSDPTGVDDFMERLHHELFWKLDQKKPHGYPDMVFTWQNNYLSEVESNDSVSHDALWASGSFIFIGLMIFLKVRSGFVFLAGILGLGLSFLTAYYWCLIHFDIPEITLLHVSSLFVMMGIGADDIFLMVDSFEHTKTAAQDKKPTDDGNDNDSDGESIHKHPTRLDAEEIIRERMESAYSTAGSMMLVSSLTTAICFFSNAFAVVVVIKEFGIYMGMVVLVNFIHVMTILPSAILVNELYFIPWKKMRFGHTVMEEIEISGGPRREEVSSHHSGEGIIDDCFASSSKDSDSLDDSSSKDSSSSSHDDLEQAPATVEATERDVDGHRQENLNRMDCWLVHRYAPFVQRRRMPILIILGIISASLGILGITSFAVSDGTIILFSQKYNLGRLTALNAEYFNGDLTQTIEPDAAGAIFGDLLDGVTGDISEPDDASAGSAGNEDTPNDDGLIVNPESPVDTSPPGPITTDPDTGQPPTDSQGSGSGGSSDSSNVVPPFSGGSSRPGGSTGGSGESTGGGSPVLGDNGLPVCYNLCQNGGICNFQGTCTCLNGWAGTTCALPTCPVNGRYCTGNGDCVPHPNGVPGSSICRCFDGYSGRDCSKITGDDGDKTLKRRQAVVVSFVWGAERLDERSALWIIRGNYSPSEKGGEDESSKNNTQDMPEFEFKRNIEVSDPGFQEWMLKVVKLARNETGLSVQIDKPTWIEILEQSALDAGVGFPIPKDLFVGYVQLLKDQNDDFAYLIRSELGTLSPGLAGDFLFASVTLLADVVDNVRDGESLSSATLRKWTEFVETANAMAPPKVVPMVAQSRTFLNAHRSEETISSTATSWIIANALCLLIILMFTRSIRLSLMVMSVIILIFLCLAGFLFGILVLPFGPVEALGVSIFIGLSANYSLHIVHAYQHSPDHMALREDKVRHAIFATGSPIIASALSTIGGCLFLFGCRTYVFIELGLLICSITTFALVFSMSFLPAWLSISGPVMAKASSTENEADESVPPPGAVASVEAYDDGSSSSAGCPSAGDSFTQTKSTT